MSQKTVALAEFISKSKGARTMERKDLKNYLKRYKGFKEDDGYYSLKKEYSYSKYNGEVFDLKKT